MLRAKAVKAPYYQALTLLMLICLSGWLIGTEEFVPGTGLRAKSLDNLSTRKWYLQQTADIPNRVDKSLTLREQGLQTFKMRNEIKMQARQLMSDRTTAATLPPSDSLRDIAMKNYTEGNVGDSLWSSVINSSRRTNQGVDSSLGIDNPYNRKGYRR